MPVVRHDSLERASDISSDKMISQMKTKKIPLDLSRAAACVLRVLPGVAQLPLGR